MTLRNLTGWRYVEILQGDTLQSIAARELQDAEKWALIATINGLQPPYLTGDSSQASDGVKLYGQALIVPGSTPQISSEVDPNAVFGVDLDLTDGVLSATAGDMTQVKAHANLRQALRHRVVSDKGELLFHLDYGCLVRKILGQANGPTKALLGAAFVRSSLAADPRVQSVETVTAKIEGSATLIEATVVPVSGAPINLTVTV